VVEEGAFRGLLYGVMLKSLGKGKALILQAVLFWLSHIFEATNPVYFFVLIPLGTLFLTFMINKYKMIWPSIVLHVFLNVFFTPVATLVNTLFH
jgi:membrane protease YdiL (CAAX protease family)